MTLFFRVVLAVHVAAGVVALSTFWLPLVTRKGGRTHRRVGWVYVVAAEVLAATALMRCIHLVGDRSPQRFNAGIFLAYVSVLAAASAQLAVRALRTKHRTAPSRSAVDLLPPLLLVAGGIALAVFGVQHARLLYVLFAALGTAQGAAHLRFWLTRPSQSRVWVLAHMTAMGVSCITTLTAFVVVNARRLGMHTFDLTVWVVPIVVLGTGLTLWRRHYARRLDAGGAPFRGGVQSKSEHPGHGGGTHVIESPGEPG